MQQPVKQLEAEASKANRINTKRTGYRVYWLTLSNEHWMVSSFCIEVFPLMRCRAEAKARYQYHSTQEQPKTTLWIKCNMFFWKIQIQGHRARKYILECVQFKCNSDISITTYQNPQMKEQIENLLRFQLFSSVLTFSTPSQSML